MTPIGDQFLYSIANEWKVEAVGDLNRDGFPDFVFRNSLPGLGFDWLWNGASLGFNNFVFGIDPVWVVVAYTDWNGDGSPDFV